MGVIETDKWLELHFNQPVELCNLAKPDLEDKEDFYRYLLLYGMYKPTQDAKRLVTRLKDEKLWVKARKIYETYKKKWKGPEVEIFIFPIDQSNRFFMNELKGKSGLALEIQMYLFVSDHLNEKELEALFVHEYHHVARLNRYKKTTSEYTLLDSILFEGLAELAVLNCCGKKHVAFWTENYSNDVLKRYYKKFYEPNLKTQRINRKHDDLLLGKKGIPPMLGYSIGYALAKGYIEKNNITMLDSLKISSEKFLLNNEFIESIH